MERLERMLAPVTVRYRAGDGMVEAMVAELHEAQPLVEGEAVVDAPAALELLDGWGRPTGVRFCDLPAGQERDAFLDVLVMVSRGSTPLTPLGRATAQGLVGELAVFTTPA